MLEAQFYYFFNFLKGGYQICMMYMNDVIVSPHNSKIKILQKLDFENFI